MDKAILPSSGFVFAMFFLRLFRFKVEKVFEKGSHPYLHWAFLKVSQLQAERNKNTVGLTPADNCRNKPSQSL